mmetsp:Transcript_94097/g.271115  ORF Transcript_94097/g.271115 Transcript_94097/m.271115 type:complete len:241 (+) Transcript_94097:94-816(+)
MAAISSYAMCQSACSAGWVACYSAAGLVAGTVTAGIGAPAAALACNAACGSCMSVCATKFLAEGAAETAASGGIMGPVNIVAGAAVAAGGWFGRRLIGSAITSVGARIAGTGASAAAGAGAGAASGTAAASGATAASGIGVAALAALPWIIGTATVASAAYGAYRGYQWWNEERFPEGIEVIAIAGDHAGQRGRVVGIAMGDIVVDFGDGQYHRIARENLQVPPADDRFLFGANPPQPAG